MKNVKVFLVVVSALSIFCLTSCGSRFDQEKFERVQMGMTRSQVVAILGEPTESVASVAGDSACTWKQGKSMVIVQFSKDGKVVAKQRPRLGGPA